MGNPNLVIVRDMILVSLKSDLDVEPTHLRASISAENHFGKHHIADAQMSTVI